MRSVRVGLAFVLVWFAVVPGAIALGLAWAAFRLTVPLGKTFANGKLVDLPPKPAGAETLVDVMQRVRSAQRAATRAGVH